MLQAGTDYYLGVEIGEAIEGIAVGPRTVIDPKLLPAMASLRVVLFPFEGGIEIPGPDLGVLRLHPDGHATVERQPGEPADAPIIPGFRTAAILPLDEIRRRRLLFPVRAGGAIGPQRIRCSIYHEQLLVHSRVITAQVSPARLRAALSSEGPGISFTSDYLLSHRLSAAELSAAGSYDLSLMINGDGDTHDIRIFGREELRESVRLSKDKLRDLIVSLRETLRRVAWGKPEEWKNEPGFTFKYTDKGDKSAFAGDLLELARLGYRSYTNLVRSLASSLDQPLVELRAKFDAILAKPSHIQFATRTTEDELVPLAGLYQRKLNVQADNTLCPAFLAALDMKGLPLEQCRCWLGDCPSAADDTVVCPSEFWGFKHYLGVPLTQSGKRDGDHDAVLNALGSSGEPSMSIAVSTDPRFQRATHVTSVRSIIGAARSHLAETYEDALSDIRKDTHDIVYFFCHGTELSPLRRVPALVVGPVNSRYTFEAQTFADNVNWRARRPLVFLNGCGTGAVLPSQNSSLIETLIQDSGAAGVIATEITIFENFARPFAETFFRAMVQEGAELGVAMRHARLALLKDRNPLGLVYIPFALSRLRLRPGARI